MTCLLNEMKLLSRILTTIFQFKLAAFSFCLYHWISINSTFYNSLQNVLLLWLFLYPNKRNEYTRSKKILLLKTFICENIKLEHLELFLGGSGRLQTSSLISLKNVDHPPPFLLHFCRGVLIGLNDYNIHVETVVFFNACFVWNCFCRLILLFKTLV